MPSLRTVAVGAGTVTLLTGTADAARGANVNPSFMLARETHDAYTISWTVKLTPVSH
ncbi:MAG: hypothetical protein ACYDA3_14120 [Gaiellaceae bacterium]